VGEEVSALPAERIVSADPDTADNLVIGWTMEITPRALVVMFPTRFWKRKAGQEDAEIERLCGEIRRYLGIVIKEQQ
jgi:hypothetical protein